MQYPYEQDEYGRYYSGYDDTVHDGVSYTGYSNWVCSISCDPLRIHLTTRILTVQNGLGFSFLLQNVFPE